MRWFLIVITTLLLTLSATPRQASAQQCLEQSGEEARLQAGQLTTLLQIANFRGDIKYMSEIVPELETYLEGCGIDLGGRLAQVCGYECHLQLGRYRLFMASELPYLSNAGTLSRDASLLSPQTAQDHAEAGLAVLDRGLKLLARQQNGGSDDSAQQDAFRTYTRQLVGLNIVKIRLAMSVGDTWYQTMSEARIKSLAFAVSEATEVIPGAPLESQPNLSKANTQYEAAMWTLIEAKTDIPAEQSYDDLRADMAGLESDLQTRLTSVRQGMIFLNIDPIAFTTIPFEELQLRLEDAKRDLQQVESRIEQMVREWSASQENQATRAIDERRTVRSQQVNLLAHQIGKIEQEAQVFRNAVQQDITQVDAAVDTFGRRQQIRNLEIQLATKLAEFQFRQQQLQQRQELDLIVLSKEAEIERRSELRWLLSFEMTLMNLDLQISSIQGQIGEYARQISRNQTQQAQLSRQRSILETRIVDANTAINGAFENIARIDARQTEVYGLRRAVARVDICSIEEQLAFIGEAPDVPFAPLMPGETVCTVPAPSFTRREYQVQMCGDGTEPGLRGKLIDTQIQGRAFVLKCVIGDAEFGEIEPLVADAIRVDSDLSLEAELAAVECGGFTQTETDFAKGIYEAEAALLEKQRTGLEAQRDKINEQLEFIDGWARDFQNTIQGLTIGLQVVEGVLAAMAAIPETTVAAAGLASGVYTTIKWEKPAEAAVGFARGALEQAIAFGRIEIQTETQIRQLRTQITGVIQANERIDFQKSLKALALHRTHFQLAGREAEGLQAIKELTLQNTMAGVECSNQALGLDEQVARLRAQHKRMIAAMELQSRENALLDFDRVQQLSAIDRYTNEIAILQLELEKLELNFTQLAEDTLSVEALIAAAEGRITRIDTTRATVTGLGEESLQVTNVINELRDRQQAQMLAISEAEMGFVEARIAGEETNTTAMVTALEGSIELVDQRAELRASIEQFQAETMTRVAAEREEIINLVSNIDDPTERKALFIASQEQLSELMRGIPDYISAKRSKLATANRLLHLMRQRYKLVLGLTGSRADFPLTYVKDASQLEALADDVSNLRFFNETPVDIHLAQVVVPANSGFVKTLAQDAVVKFEISPFANTEAAMREGGFLVLWDPKFRAQRNMTLIDVVIGAQYQCTGAQWNKYTLSHSGSGSVFRPLSEGSSEVVPDIVIGPRRDAQHTFYNLVDSEATVRQITEYWVSDRFAARKFPRIPGPPNDSTAILPFLGAPVYGAYELAVHPSDCPFDGAVFTLYFFFASTS